MVVGQLGRIPILEAGAKEAPLLVNDLLVVATVLFASAVALRRHHLHLDVTGGLALLFAVVGGISVAVSVGKYDLSMFQFLFSLAYLGRWLAYFSLYLVAVNFLRRGDVTPVWNSLEGAILLFAGFGIIQSAFLPGFAQIVYPDAALYTQWDPQGRRLVSTFLDPNFAGALIVMGLLVQLGRLAYGATVPAWKPLLLVAALILTLSRSSFLALALGGMVVLLARGLSRRLLKLSALAVILTLPFVPYAVDFAVTYNKLNLDDPSLLGRLIAWDRALQVLADNPVLGVGFNSYGFVQLKYGFAELSQSAFGLDGGLLFIAVMTGGVGVLIYSAMVGSVLLRCRRIRRGTDRTAAERGLAVGVSAATVALLVHSLFLNSIIYPFLTQVLWILWALTFAAALQDPQEEADRGAPGVRLVEVPR